MDTSQLNEALASSSYDKIADICDNLMLQAISPYFFSLFIGAAEGIEFQDEWPYAIHLLGHIYSNDINSARFLWKKIPAAIKEARPEVVAVWRIGQKLWTRDYVGVHEAIRGFSWSPEVQPFVSSFAGNATVPKESSLSSGLRLDVDQVNGAWVYICVLILLYISFSHHPSAELYKKRMFELLLSAYSTISTQDSACFLGMNENDAINYVLQQGWALDSASQMLTVKKQAVITEQKLDPSKLQRLTEYVFHLEH
ncbi:hypothetical protein MTR67_005902 [Solanum verrucosum]|uniref:CSN8/PSMD8/EIF3K domain-containing protein n=1 Tax=Solanum verrucosum TaxID=315347 RepID=A0AAF0T955_SOLVR|nr:hypothetical protein MTR67_005902 [Solanum verrucosum]